MTKKIKLNPRFLYDEEGKKMGVIVKIKEFNALMDELEDLHSLRTVYLRTRKPLKTTPMEVVKRRTLGHDVQ